MVTSSAAQGIEDLERWGMPFAREADGKIFGAYGFDVVDGSPVLIYADAAGTLVSEAARGEGGILTNALGERYMEKYDPERMELSTRDRVALASYTEIIEGRGTANGGVYLDVSHLPRETIFSKLPRVYRTLIDLQVVDITKEPIEIAPTAHYSMGGVWVEAADHSTGVDGLYAIGEASSGLHGANRLGGNSLIELLVYGRITGEEVAEYAKQRDTVHRSAESIGEAREEMQNLGVHPDIAGFDDLAHAYDLYGSLLAARATLESALERRESRGCHNRSDFPEQDDALTGNMVWSVTGGVTFEKATPAPESFRNLAEAPIDTSVVGKLVE